MARSHPVYLETMQITLSFATTADGYLDDDSPRRLMISTPEDWEAVLRLRASHDAILAGAETLRRDNPRCSCAMPQRGSSAVRGACAPT